jgi:D-sedoheptulose 7-phosphate isomerase
MRDYIKTYISESINVKEKILNNDNIVKQIEKAVSFIEKAYQNNNKILIAGNGGSAADAQHISTELVSRFIKERPALNALALTTNTSILTAIGNDYSYDYIFARQIEAFGNEGDVFIAISTSGNSINIINSINTAKNKGLKVVVLTGSLPSKMDNICDLLIKVPSNKTSIIQETHIMVAHIICGLVEDLSFN